MSRARDIANLIGAGGDITGRGTKRALNLQTVGTTTVDLGDWTITESSGVLYFANAGTNKMKIDASGNLTAASDVTAYGTV